MLPVCRQQSELTKSVQTITFLQLIQLELNGLPTNGLTAEYPATYLHVIE